MELILKNGKWQTKDGLTYFELSEVEKKLFEVLLNVEIILKKLIKK